MSLVVKSVNPIVPPTGLAARAPSPDEHVNIVDAAAIVPAVIVNTMTRSDVVTAVTLPTLLAQVGILAVT